MGSPRINQLEYAPARPPARSALRLGTVIVLTPLLTCGHLWYTHDVAWKLWEAMGGIRKDCAWTHFGTSNFAPTVPIHLPAGVVFYIGIRLRGVDGFRDNHVPEGPIGILLLLAGSLAAGWLSAAFIASMLWRDRPLLGRRWWRLWAMLLCWGWIVVPAGMSWIYQWTVVY